MPQRTHRCEVAVASGTSEPPALYGLDAGTGQIAWKIEDPASPSWSVVLLTFAGENLVFATGKMPAVELLDPLTGGTIWEASLYVNEAVQEGDLLLLIDDGLFVYRMPSGQATPRPPGAHA